MNGADLAALRAGLRELGAAPVHERHLMKQWLTAGPLDAPCRGDPMFLPRRVRDALPALTTTLDGLATLRSRHPAGDGGER
ncbi:MAG: rRNA methyltransferase, partial [Burkholderiaceae bacterium]